MKYYAVKTGKLPGIYTNWHEAKQQVYGFKGAIYKSFLTLDEAKAYLNAQKSEIIDSNNSLIAYVDGSFNKGLNCYGSGIVFIKNDDIIKELSFKGNNEKYVESFQIAGEVHATLRAMQWAIKNGEKHITIYFDYIGIREWAEGNWQTNKPVSKDYKSAFDQLAKHISVKFVKVKAHSNDALNDRADFLAKLAVELVK